MMLGVVSLAVSLAACDGGKDADKAKQAAAAPPPPAVVVTEVVQKTVPIYSEFVAQTDARETVEIRARVQAFLEAQHFTEGTIVKKNQLLFTLDKREFEAKLQQAKAQLEIAMARLGKAETDERRLKPLAERKAVPQQDYDNAAANLLAAQANVSAARANVVAARLDLSYTTIRSPITGLIGKRLVAPGNLVGKGEATLLDTVSSIDPIRVNATISEAEYLRFFAQAKEQGKSSAPLELILADGSVYPHKGKLVIVDRAVDQKTGTLNFARRVSEPRRPAAPRAVRSRARGRRDGQGRDPDSEAGGPGDPGHADRARGRRRQHGRAAHHPARRNGRRPADRARRPQARRTGDRRRHPEGPARLEGQSDNRRRRQPARSEPDAAGKGLPRLATRRESRGEVVHGPISSSAGRSSRSSSRS